MSAMVRTTPPRAVDIAALLPELAPLARTAVRLHPRPGHPTADESSVGGPVLWPAGEPWPTCAEHAGPVVPVVQLYARDVPGLPRPEGTDLLQVLWCPFDHEDDGYLPSTVLRWRVAAEVADPVTGPPRPVGAEEHYLPHPCVLHPEEVVEYPARLSLPRELVERVAAVEEREDVRYQYDLSVAPGCKVGGHPSWSFSDPFPMSCPDCGADVEPLLTIDTYEWDGVTSWRPVEDTDTEDTDTEDDGAPTTLEIGRGYGLQFYTCTVSPAHQHVTNMQ
jgi:hypothetical protein